MRLSGSPHARDSKMNPLILLYINYSCVVGFVVRSTLKKISLSLSETLHKFKFDF